MKRNSMWHGLVMGVLGLAGSVVAIPCAAQTASGLELSGGYQFVNIYAFGESESLGHGWYGDVAGALNPSLAIVAQVGGNYRTIRESVSSGAITSIVEANARVYQALGGLRVRRFSSGFAPYVQALAGAVIASGEGSVSVTGLSGGPVFSTSESGSDTRFALELGGGANIRLNDRIGLRVGADYLRVFVEGEGSNLLRLHTGITISR